MKKIHKVWRTLEGILPYIWAIFLVVILTALGFGATVWAIKWAFTIIGVI